MAEATRATETSTRECLDEQRGRPIQLIIRGGKYEHTTSSNLLLKFELEGDKFYILNRALSWREIEREGEKGRERGKEREGDGRRENIY